MKELGEEGGGLEERWNKSKEAFDGVAEVCVEEHWERAEHRG